MTRRSRLALWTLWGTSTLAAGAWLTVRLVDGGHFVFLPGETTAGHHQIELACTACHAEAFPDPDAMQAKCVGCHGDALAAARDSHPPSKFTDPRNTDRTALLDARFCVTCHTEHRPALAHEMGVTVPQDVCGVCHSSIGEERPSHAGMAFETCGSAGCHNYHDNRALYQNFLVRNHGAPALRAETRVLERNFAAIAAYLDGYPQDTFPLRPLAAADADAPRSAAAASVVEQWSASAHAATGANCTACHANGAGGEWRNRPGYDACATCHRSESAGFRLGKHGMRLNEANGRALPPLTVRDARLPMKPEARDRTLDCGACHSAHRFDTAFAATDACLGCHADQHSVAFLGSPHFTVAADDGAERLTCATCHLPRVEQAYDFGAYVHVLVQHNQSENLRPNEKMLRDVCMNCHGLGFSIDALADTDLVRGNFFGPPGVHVQSIDLAAERAGDVDRRRQAERSGEPSR